MSDLPLNATVRDSQASTRGRMHPSRGARPFQGDNRRQKQSNALNEKLSDGKDPAIATKSKRALDTQENELERSSVKQPKTSGVFISTFKDILVEDDIFYKSMNKRGPYVLNKEFLAPAFLAMSGNLGYTQFNVKPRPRDKHSYLWVADLDGGECIVTLRLRVEVGCDIHLWSGHEHHDWKRNGLDGKIIGYLPTALDENLTEGLKALKARQDRKNKPAHPGSRSQIDLNQDTNPSNEADVSNQAISDNHPSLLRGSPTLETQIESTQSNKTGDQNGSTLVDENGNNSIPFMNIGSSKPAAASAQSQPMGYRGDASNQARGAEQTRKKLKELEGKKVNFRRELKPLEHEQTQEAETPLYPLRELRKRELDTLKLLRDIDEEEKRLEEALS
ncbi:MAG: hypothetical protein Q9168_000162 [Polycauliona sp. 1 TL-2023]